MLVDHRLAAERAALADRRNRRNIPAYGDYFKSTIPDWFGSISLNDRLARNPDRAVKELTAYFSEMEQEAGCPIAVILAEARGSLERRLHYHFLASGVDHLSRKRWWRLAFERFGNTRILPYDDEKGGVYYVAENALSKDGNLYFLGKWWELQKGRPL